MDSREGHVSVGKEGPSVQNLPLSTELSFCSEPSDRWGNSSLRLRETWGKLNPQMHKAFRFHQPERRTWPYQKNSQLGPSKTSIATKCDGYFLKPLPWMAVSNYIQSIRVHLVLNEFVCRILEEGARKLSKASMTGLDTCEVRHPCAWSRGRWWWEDPPCLGFLP